MLTLTIKTDNAAFTDDAGEEIARILRHAADKLAEGYDYVYLMDYNGNNVGTAELNVESE